jgi:hypothetical protein
LSDLSGEKLKKKQVKDISGRMVAVIIASVMGTVGAGSIIGVEVWKSAALAGFLGVAVVAETLARKYLEDGQLSDQEINDAFAKTNEGKGK